MSVQLNDAQRRNFVTALALATTDAQRQRLALAVWTESRGRNLANDGSRSPNFTAVLRRSLQMDHDGVGDNFRSVGILQQIPEECDGVWGPMVDCMNPAVAPIRFLRALEVTDTGVFDGKLFSFTTQRSERLVKDFGSPVIRDVLAVQQPALEEAASDNYGQDNLAAALDILATLQPSLGPLVPAPPEEAITVTEEDDMGTLVKDPASGWVYAIAPGYFQPLDESKQKQAVESGLFRAQPVLWNSVQLIERRRVALADWQPGCDERAIQAGRGILVPDAGVPGGIRFA